jgi:hypothetical protein
VVPLLPKGLGSNDNLTGAEQALRDLVWQCAGSTGLAATKLLTISEMPERTFYRALETLVRRGFVRNAGSKTRTCYVRDEPVTAITANYCQTPPGSSPLVTANNPPLRGLAVIGGSGSDGALDLSGEDER